MPCSAASRAVTVDVGLRVLAQAVGQALAARGLRLATAESCTGGGIAQAVTAIAGSSAWFERGFVTYSNDAKRELLGVSGQTLAAFGAVSGETVAEMAQGALAHAHAEVAVAVSGIAGPDGGSADKPVGTVWLAWAAAGRATRVRRCLFAGDRDAVRHAAVLAALDGVLALLADADA